MSDIVLTQLLAGSESIPTITRAGTPLPVVTNRSYLLSDTVRVYFEIYNLPVDLSGRTRYEITYSLQFIKSSDTGIKGLISKMFPGKRESIANTYREGGKSRDVTRDLTFAVDELRPGRYQLTISVNELVLGYKTTATTELLLLEAR
jgi:hypothetical protein